MSFKELVSSPDVAFVISIIGLLLSILGAISSYYGIKSYFDQRKTNNAYKYLLENATREWEGKYTDEEVCRLKKQLDNLTLQITHDIPIRARTEYLKYRLNSVLDELHKWNKEYEDIKKELSKLGESQGMDKELNVYIEETIDNRPQYKKISFIILMFIMLFLFLSQPMVLNILVFFLNEAIWVTRAKLYVEHITTYIMGMIMVSFVMMNINMPKINIKIRKRKRVALFYSLCLFLVWSLIVYFVSFNVLITGFWEQIIAGIFSLIIFGMVIKLLVAILKH